jgi:hypothetical protein
MKHRKLSNALLLERDIRRVLAMLLLANGKAARSSGRDALE